MKRQRPDNHSLFRCPACGEGFPLTEKFWYWRNDSQKWRPLCRACHQKKRHRYEAACINCGKKINATLEQIKKGEIVFCSHQCRTKEFISKDALDKMSATQFKKGDHGSPLTEFKKGVVPKTHFIKGHAPWNKAGLTATCCVCGKELDTTPSRMRKSQKQYCSRECSYLGAYNGGREEQIRRKRLAVKELNDQYVRTVLSNAKIDVTPETIELKREQITMKRTIKKLKEWRKENDPTYTPVSRKQHSDAPPNENH